MPNVTALGADHTPRSGVVMAATQPDIDAPTPRPRARTGGLFRSRDGDSPPSWMPVLLALLVGSGGGAVGISTLGSPAVEPAKVAEIDREIDAHATAIAANAASLAALDRRTSAREQQLWAEQVRTTRWMASTLQAQSTAITAIADKLNVRVDLHIPPLVLGESPPPTESESQ